MRRYISALLGISTIGAVTGYVFTNSTLAHICESEEYVCRNFYNHIGDPLFYGFLCLGIVFVFLLIYPAAFNAWKNLALWILPFLIDLFATYKQPDNFFSPDPIEIYTKSGISYVLLSLLVIGISFYRRGFGKSHVTKIPSKKQKTVFWIAWAIYVAIIIGAHLFD